MARLIDCFRALFSFGLELDAPADAAHSATTSEAAQRRALDLLEAARDAAHSLGASASQVESASFAVIAWLDEILARRGGPAAGTAALQRHLFNSSNAHSEFFHHLSALGAGDDEVREVYRHALAHGFKGQYYFEDGDDGELGRLKDLLARRWPAPADTAGVPLERRLAVPQVAQRREDRVRLRTGAALAISLALALSLAPTCLLWLTKDRAREAPPTLAQRVEQRLHTLACADLAAASDADGATRVTGFVAQEADLARVAREVHSTAGVTAASFDIQLRVWP
ncbi:MAG: DotU family type IV/VI secretion system protein, partial [Variovorax sp.]